MLIDGINTGTIVPTHKVVNVEHFSDGTNISTTLDSDQPLSVLYTYNPTYIDGTTKFIMITRYSTQLTGGLNDNRGSSRLYYFDGTSYVISPGQANLDGAIQGGAETQSIYSSSSLISEFSTAHLRTDNDNLTVKLYGHSDFGGTFQVTDISHMILEVLV